MQNISSPPAAYAEVQINENMAALGQGFCFAHKVEADTGLVVGISGGTFDANTVADATVTCTNAATNYIVAHRTTRAISTATSTTNWLDTATYGRIARAVFAGGLLTLFADERNSTGGIFDHAAAVVSSDPELAAIAGLTSAADKIPYFTGSGTAALLTRDIDGTLTANSDTAIATQKATKTYVDAKVAGLSWKQAVRAATTATGTLATAYENGDSIDGVTLATGDRILIKNQSTGSENGIYTVNASGAPPRSTDADSGAELVNATVYISDGTTLADTQWTCTTNAAITVGTTALVFAQLGGSAAAQPYDVIVFLPGLQTAATQKLYRGKVARAVSFAANFAGSYFAASANATASTVFDVQKNGVSIGTVTIAAGGTTATFATSGGAAQALVAGDLLVLLGPATADATLADPSFTLAGTR